MATHRALGVSSRSAHSTLVPATRNERECAREQLERILVSPVFRNSKRYASVLRYIVVIKRRPGHAAIVAAQFW